MPILMRLEHCKFFIHAQVLIYKYKLMSLFGVFQHSGPFIDTWNNIHLFQSFDYKISDPTAVANCDDFVWGAELDHVAAIRRGNPNMPLDFANPALLSWQIQTYAQPAKTGTMGSQRIMWTCKTSSGPAAST